MDNSQDIIATVQPLELPGMTFNYVKMWLHKLVIHLKKDDTVELKNSGFIRGKSMFSVCLQQSGS
jgi:hypothetical protein